MSKVNFSDGQVFDFYKPHEAVGMSNWPPSLTRQEFAEECDINVIMSRYENTGQLPMNRIEPQYVDLTALPPDFQTAMQMVIDAGVAFMTLPAHVRREFDNDPQMFVAFASDPENLEQMRTWGLAPPAPVVEEPAPAPAPVVAPAPSPSPAPPKPA